MDSLGILSFWGQPIPWSSTNSGRSPYTRRWWSEAFFGCRKVREAKLGDVSTKDGTIQNETAASCGFGPESNLLRSCFVARKTPGTSPHSPVPKSRNLDVCA